MFVFHKIIFKVSPYYQVHIYRGNQCYSTVIIINWSTAKKDSFLNWQWMCSFYISRSGFNVTIYPYLKWQWLFYFLRRFFSFLYYCQDFYRTWLYIRVTQWVSYRKQELRTFHDHLSSPLVVDGVRVTHLSSLFSVLFFTLLVFFLCLVPRLLCLWIINVWLPLHFFLTFIYM